METTPVELLRLAIEEAKDLTCALLKSPVRGIPPIVAQDYASLIGVKRIVKADLSEVDALLLPGSEGYSIMLNEKQHPLRQNFSCAHEIAHVLLDKVMNGLPSHSVEFRSTKSLNDLVTEKLCNRVAAELLMPEDLFVSYLRCSAVSVDSIQSLANIFRTSVPATARRVAELSREPCIALYWKLAQRSGWRESKPCLIWTSDDGEFSNSKYDIPRFISVTRGSSVFRSFQSNAPVAEFERLSFGNIRRSCYIESMAFGQNPHRYIISLLFPKRKKIDNN